MGYASDALIDALDRENRKLRELCTDLNICRHAGNCLRCEHGRFCDLRLDERCAELGVGRRHEADGEAPGQGDGRATALEEMVAGMWAMWRGDGDCGGCPESMRKECREAGGGPHACLGAGIVARRAEALGIRLG